MRGKLNTLEDLDIQLLGVDPHEVYSAKFLLKDTGLSTDDIHYPLLMDPSLTVSATYGVAFQMRIHVELSNRPSTFIIDKQGVIRYALRGKMFLDRPSISTIIDEVKKLK